jgi:hypothetical protein
MESVNIPEVKIVEGKIYIPVYREKIYPVKINSEGQIDFDVEPVKGWVYAEVKD